MLAGEVAKEAAQERERRTENRPSQPRACVTATRLPPLLLAVVRSAHIAGTGAGKTSSTPASVVSAATVTTPKDPPDADDEASASSNVGGRSASDVEEVALERVRVTGAAPGGERREEEGARRRIVASMRNTVVSSCERSSELPSASH